MCVPPPTQGGGWRTTVDADERLIVYQVLLGPSDTYIRPPAITLPEVTVTKPPKISRRNSSGFSRRSYDVAEDADDEEFKQVFATKGEDPIVGAMFGRGVLAQVWSSWWL
jgi:hypothetical protein